jgi:shikimate kinase
MSKKHTEGDVAAVRSTLGTRSIVLVGLMGAGKTSVGRRLAEKLELPFVDADQEIETAAGKSIPEIFADHGEPYFREGEKRVIARLLEGGPQVLATGGGAYMNAETREEIRNRGISVWLKADLMVLLKRVAKRDNRPLLNNKNPEEVMRQLINDRYPVYANADVTVESREVQHGHVVNDIIRSIVKHGEFNTKSRENDQG